MQPCEDSGVLVDGRGRRHQGLFVMWAGAVTTVPLAVTDTWGAWPSFVGGGVGAEL